MKLYEFTQIFEDVSKEESLKNIIDIFTTQFPQLYRSLDVMAQKYAKNNGSIDKNFNFITGSQKSNWYQSVGNQSLRTALYNLLKYLPPKLKPALQDYLNNTVGKGGVSNIIDTLIPVLRDIGEKLNNPKLIAAANAALNAVKRHNELIAKLNAEYDTDDADIKSPPKEQNPVARQNAAVDAIINDVLSRIDRRAAGEIRNILARSENKLAVLQQELTRRGINP